MKTFLLSLLFSMVFVYLAQNVINPALPSKLTRISTPKLAINEADQQLMLLKMEFNGAIPQSKLAEVKVNQITSITLAYTSYKLNISFDQLKLNAERMQKLYNLLPALKENKNIDWYWVEQTDCDNTENCNDFFHGFIIKYKDEMKELKRETETDLLAYYTDMYEGKADTAKMDSIIKTRKLPMIKVCATVTTSTRIGGNNMGRYINNYWNNKARNTLKKSLVKCLGDEERFSIALKQNEKGKISLANEEMQSSRMDEIVSLLNSKLRFKNPTLRGKRIACEFVVNVDLTKAKEEFINITQTPILPTGEKFDLDKFLYIKTSKEKCEFVDTTGGINANTADDVVMAVFNRNKQWQNALVATDVTGSMTPYLAQFQLWHKLHLNANSGNHDFVFFNDGDTKPDHVKITGSVGGVYYVNTTSYADLQGTISIAMKGGSGSDCPENNIEAVIEGLKKNPNCKEVIMIADNWATPRDLSLLNEVKVPIRLILCGTSGGFNTDYLEMVRKNHGSVHTIEEDIYNLASLGEGQSVKIGAKNYKLKNGKLSS